MRPRELAAAISVGLFAWLLYRATMLPGMDLGDTPSFQARVGYALLTPRDGYPLYSALGTAMHALVGGDHARALNLASVFQASIACAVVVLLGIELTGSVAIAVGTALLFAGSYTFWSQSIIAEVYALHLLFVVLVLLLTLQWGRQPTYGRLAALLAVYALGFGNHLSMILLAPGLVLFLFSIKGSSLLAPRVVATATVMALLGSLQYAWNLSTLWLLPNPPASLAEGLGRFWFDVTKVDWRETMVLEVPRALLRDHAAMYTFDLRQQFGWPIALVAAAGLAALVRSDWRRAALLAAVYVAFFTFAFSYNVGDTHVFYLPSHLIVALLAASGLAALGRASGRPGYAALCLIAYASARIWIDYPALDRSQDERPSRLIAALTAGLDDQRDVLLADLNWQVQNGLSYFGQQLAPEVAYERLPAVILYAPAFVADNRAIDRAVVVTDQARSALLAAYGPLFATTPDLRATAPSLAQAVEGLPSGTRYVLCLLTPTRDYSVDEADLAEALARLGGATAIDVPGNDYVAVAGLVGRPPDVVLGSNEPFRRSLNLDDVTVRIRMESWLSADTIRRMGFGHVIAGRQHTLIVERGVSFVAFDGEGRPIRVAYASNIFAPQSRYLISPGPALGAVTPG